MKQRTNQYYIVFFVPCRVEDGWADNLDQAKWFIIHTLAGYGYELDCFRDLFAFDQYGRKVAQICTPEQVREMRG